MKITHNPFLNNFSLILGAQYHHVRIQFDVVAPSEVRKNMLMLSLDGHHVASIVGDDAAEFTHELKLAEAAKIAREMGQRSPVVHGLKVVQQCAR
jgi:hypothetical protein